MGQIQAVVSKNFSNMLKNNNFFALKNGVQRPVKTSVLCILRKKFFKALKRDTSGERNAFLFTWQTSGEARKEEVRSLKNVYTKGTFVDQSCSFVLDGKMYITGGHGSKREFTDQSVASKYEGHRDFSLFRTAFEVTQITIKFRFLTVAIWFGWIVIYQLIRTPDCVPATGITLWPCFAMGISAGTSTKKSSNKWLICSIGMPKVIP